MLFLRCLRHSGCAVVLFCMACGNMSAKLSLPNLNATRSVSGQFVVTGPAAPVTSPLATNVDAVRLDPALLAVSAERIKRALWRDLDVDASTPWRGKIYLQLHPARSLDESVTILSEHFTDGWEYGVALPNILPRTRMMRAITGVVLLELANRGAGARSAEVPAWLTDGLSQQLLATGTLEVVLSAPIKTVNGFLESRTDVRRRGIDPLARARGVLREHPPLTFEQLSWPTATQVAGADGGVYRASAQLFVAELLKLKRGPADLRTMLQTLPEYYNWQTAFLDAFRAEFARPLDVEKWWALQVVGFMAHSPGPVWTPAVSRMKLDQLLSVPVDFRAASNALPTHADISLQSVIRNFKPPRQTLILQTKLRDLELAQFRMARTLAPLTAEYRAAIAAYLDEDRNARLRFHFGWPMMSRKASAQGTVQKLDALDARRRTVEAAIKPDLWRP